MMTETDRTIGISDSKTDTPALPKTTTVALTDASGCVMSVVAERKGDAARTYVIYTDTNKKNARGMTDLIGVPLAWYFAALMFVVTALALIGMEIAFSPRVLYSSAQRRWRCIS